MQINLNNANFFMNLNNHCHKEHSFLDNNNNSNQFNPSFQQTENLIHGDQDLNIPNPDSDSEPVEGNSEPKSFNNKNNNNINNLNNLNLSLNENEYQEAFENKDAITDTKLIQNNSGDEKINYQNSAEINNTNLTQISTKVGMQSDIEEGELLESSVKSKSLAAADENPNRLSALNGNESVCHSNYYNESGLVFENKNANNFSCNFDAGNSSKNNNSGAKNENFNSNNSSSDKSRESIEKLNYTTNNSNNNSRMFSNNFNNSLNTNSNHSVGYFNNGNNNNNNRNNNPQKLKHSNNAYNNNNNKKGNNSYNNLSFNKNNLKIQNTNNNNNSNNSIINNPQKNYNNNNNNNIHNFNNNNNEQQNMYNNYAQYMQYMQNLNNLNNPNPINQLANPLNSNNNSNPINFQANFIPQNNNYNSNNNNPKLNQIIPLNNISNPNITNINAFNPPTNNTIQNQNNFLPAIPNNPNNIKNFNNNPNNVNTNSNPVPTIATQAPEKSIDPEFEMREFKLIYSDQPLSIQLNGKIKKYYKLNCLSIYKMVTHDIFLQVFNSRLNFLTYNQLIVNMTFQLEKDLSHAATRKFLLELTEKNSFGFIKFEKSYYLIFSSLNKTMYNNLGKNIFSLFIINDYQKVQQLKKACCGNLNLNSNEKKNNTENPEHKEQIASAELTKIKAEKEKLEKTVDDIKRKLENERNNTQEVKGEFQKFAKRAKMELESDRVRISELHTKLKCAESKVRELEAKLRAANERCKSMELGNIFMKNRSSGINEALNKNNKNNSSNFNKISDAGKSNSENKENFNSNNININRNASAANNNINLSNAQGTNQGLNNPQMKNSKFNFKALSHLASFENKQIILTDKAEIKLNLETNLNEIELELSDIDETSNNAEKEDSYNRIINKATFGSENNQNINSVNSNNSFNCNTIGTGNIISETSLNVRGENEEWWLSKINELKEKLDAHCCVICYENSRDCVFEDCGHLTCCYECIQNEMKRIDLKSYQRSLKLKDKVNTFKFKFDFKCPVCQYKNKNFMKIIVS